MTTVIRHETIGSKAASDRLRIAHLSDLHLWFSDHKLRAIERILAEWRPDVIALTGDYADTPFGQRLAVAWMQTMALAYPLCWIAGNHDRWWGPAFARKLESVPRAHPIDQRDAWIVGKSGTRYRVTSLERMSNSPVATADEPTIVLLHDPAAIDPRKLNGCRNRLLLAGHLHGGQITLWRDRHGRPQPAAACYKWLVDRAVIGNATLIVSRGLGETLPIRIRAPREVVMVDFWAPASHPSERLTCDGATPQACPTV